MSHSWKLILFWFAGGLLVPQFYAATPNPVVFFSDLISGPAAGGEGDNGVIVTIVGNNFGASRGSSTVTVGGGAVAVYKSWTNTQIQVAIGSNAKTGPIAVQVNGVTSQCANHDPGGCNFTVRAGNIYYVSPSGSDSASGQFTSPWKTLYHAVRQVAAGDTIYVKDGFSTTAPDGTGWHSALLLSSSYTNTGMATSPIAIVAYPGASVTIGSNTAQSAGGDTTLYGLRTDGSISNFVLSGLTLRGPSRALSVDGGSNWRAVNTDSSAGDPSQTVGGAVQFSQTTQVQYYGNNVHDAGGNSKEGHALYFTTDTNHVWAGWNKLQNNLTCNSLQFHSSPTTGGTGNDQYDLHVHDNYFTGDRCSGINFATVDPSQGTVEAYNNVLNHVGIGPTPSDGAWVYACIYAAGILNNGPAPSGTVQIYNNTMYDCGSSGSGNSNYLSANVVIGDQGSGSSISYNLENNIFDGLSGESPYFSFGAPASSNYVQCSYDLFYSNGSAPSYCSHAVSADPKLAGTSGAQLGPQAGSPAIDTGATISGLGFDYVGISRPQGSAYDLGAFEYFSGQPVAPSPPHGLTTSRVQ